MLIKYIYVESIRDIGIKLQKEEESNIDINTIRQICNPYL